MSKIKIKTPTVSVKWLYGNLELPNLVVLDASIKKVTNSKNETKRSLKIPSARYFDLKTKFSDVSGAFPNTFSSVEQFEKEARALGINKESIVVVYDDKGVYSSPRAWWLFKAFGHHNVVVLDGGLPEWEVNNFETETDYNITFNAGDFKAVLDRKLMKFFKDIQDEIETGNSVVIDARSDNRFKGLEPEPRTGLRSGQIPNAYNLHYMELLEGNCFKNNQELKAIFNKFAAIEKPMIFSCGSGITACVLALGAHIVGYNNCSVYDGSWTEWGSLTTE
ncbi:sulfurtransferase [Flavobacteriales bacterium 34_180_T64]|nr:sulfurtransferase [Flavobacteriales bacterium 34_180_T64]